MTIHTRLVIVALALAIAAIMAVPRAAVACTCAELGEGSVVFAGTVVDSPNRSILMRDVFEGNAGVYTFDVESVTRGDPMDGRVYTPFGYGGCGRVFELGATYQVHAYGVDPDTEHFGVRPGVPLATSICMEGERLRAPDALVAIRTLAFTPQAIGLAALGLGLVAGIGLYVRRRRRWSAVRLQRRHPRRATGCRSGAQRGGGSRRGG